MTEVHHEQEPTVGLEYERRLRGGASRWGLGAFVERVDADEAITIAAPALFLHAAPWLKLTLAAGLERSHGEEEELIRLGAALERTAGRWIFGLSGSADFVDDETIAVYGITIGRGF